jgi:predicted molibdopterin-dependent oxidoreductase YjgC
MHGIPIPTLCNHPKLSPFGGCRLCIVELEGAPRPVASCTTTVAEGMVVQTATPKLEELRKLVLELLISDHPNDCMVCEAAGSCTLQDLAYTYGVRGLEYPGERRTYAKRDGNPFIERDLEKCVLCGRCVKVCDEIQGVEAIDFGYRGFKSKICTAYEKDLDCEFCGQCVAVCPTGALTGKLWTGKGRLQNTRAVDTVCPYCGTGCNITAHVRNNEIVRVTSKAGTWNEGWLCVKGRFGYDFVKSPERLTTPLIKRAGRLEEATWEEALALVADRLQEIRGRYGADAIGGLSSARCTNEENYAFQKLMRAGVGTNNVDHCARL